LLVVLHTNVLISALLTSTGNAAAVIDAWFDNRFTLLTHPLQLDELRAVTRREAIRKLIRPSTAGRLINQIGEHAATITDLPHTRRSRDPADDFLLALCEAGNADYLVTGDKAGLLSLKRHGRMRIVALAEFARRLKKRS
jgi:putative PIN family toxin of toxin-antitoxin system